MSGFLATPGGGGGGGFSTPSGGLPSGGSGGSGQGLSTFGQAVVNRFNPLSPYYVGNTKGVSVTPSVSNSAVKADSTGITVNGFKVPWADIGIAVQGLSTITGSPGTETTGKTNTDTNSASDIWHFIDQLVNNSNTTNTNTQSNTSTAFDQTGQTTPTLSPESTALMNQLIAQMRTQLKSTDISGLRSQGLANVNNSSDAQQKAVDNIMASRGLATSPVAASSAAGVQSQRIADQTAFLNNLPLLKNQLDLANLSGATALLGTLPKGSTTQLSGSQVGQSSQVGQTTQSGQTTTASTGRDVGSSSTSSRGTTSTSARTPGDLLGGLAQITTGLFDKPRVPTRKAPTVGVDYDPTVVHA